MASLAQIQPEYEFFTGVEVRFSVDGDSSKEFIISKLGEHFQSLVIQEGTVSGDNQLASSNGGNVASGSLTLYDEDNSIFLSLIASKSSESGNPLLNQLTITLKTYTGNRVYENCRVSDWSYNFSGGVPEVTLKWQSIPGNSSPAISNPNKPSIDINSAKDKLKNVGVKNFADFKKAIKDSFTDDYKFVYSKTREISNKPESLSTVEDDGKILVFGEKGDQPGYIYIPRSCMDTNGEEGEDNKAFRFEMKGNMDNYSLLNSVMSEFCQTALVSLKNGQEDKNALKLGFIIKDTYVILFSFVNYTQMTIPQPMGTADFLNNSVFIYNSSLPQGSTYTTPQGNKIVFSINNISTSFDFSKVIVAFTSDQSNINNPNGNMLLTSRGTLTVPEGMPQVLQQSIAKLASLTLTQNLEVSITVYNFIHFYCFGETPVNLIVYDHKGNVHPLSGRMRVNGYTYTLDTGGVIKADVKLSPLYVINAEDYTSSNTEEAQDSTTSSQTNSDKSLGSVSNTSVSNGSSVKSNISLNSSVSYITIQKA